MIDWVKELSHIQSDMVHTLMILALGCASIFKMYRLVEKKFVDRDDLAHIIEKRDIEIKSLNRRLDDANSIIQILTERALGASDSNKEC